VVSSEDHQHLHNGIEQHIKLHHYPDRDRLRQPINYGLNNLHANCELTLFIEWVGLFPPLWECFGLPVTRPE
jgi:hypothetical protein